MLRNCLNRIISWSGSLVLLFLAKRKGILLRSRTRLLFFILNFERILLLLLAKCFKVLNILLIWFFFFLFFLLMTFLIFFVLLINIILKFLCGFHFVFKDKIIQIFKYLNLIELIQYMNFEYKYGV